VGDDLLGDAARVTTDARGIERDGALEAARHRRRAWPATVAALLGATGTSCSLRRGSISS
jgi:hypothetical protein